MCQSFVAFKESSECTYICVVRIRKNMLGRGMLGCAKVQKVIKCKPLGSLFSSLMFHLFSQKIPNFKLIYCKHVMNFGTTVYRMTHPRGMHVKCYVHLLLLRVATSFLEDVLFKSLTIHSKKCLKSIFF